MSSAEVIDDQPIGISVSDWNALHTESKSPERFEGLGLSWHAYATEDKLIDSTAWADFWKLADASAFEKRIVTNYLLRFAINPDPASRVRVPFYVDTPNWVQQIDLDVESNVGSLATNYTFIFR
jgi:hypothetical protein